MRPASPSLSACARKTRSKIDDANRLRDMPQIASLCGIAIRFSPARARSFHWLPREGSRSAVPCTSIKRPPPYRLHYVNSARDLVIFQSSSGISPNTTLIAALHSQYRAIFPASAFDYWPAQKLRKQREPPYACLRQPAASQSKVSALASNFMSAAARRLRPIKR